MQHNSQITFYDPTVLNRREQNMAQWIWYWRENPHRFIEEVLDIPLHLFQKVIVYYVFRSNDLSFIACRGIGKTFTVYIALIAKSILYPNHTTVAAGQTLKDLSVLVKKWTNTFCDMSPIVKNEINHKESSYGDNALIVFKNGSRIVVKPPSQNARNERANTLWFDEHRMIPVGIVKNVFEPMQNGVVIRNIKSLKKYTVEEQKQFVDAPLSIVKTSSSWYQNNWSYSDFVELYKGGLKGSKTYAFAIPWQVGVICHLLKTSRMYNIFHDPNRTSSDIELEFGATFVGEDSSSFLARGDFNVHRTLNIPFYAYEDVSEYEFNGDYNKLLSQQHSLMERVDGEIRVIAADTAMMAGKRNDSSSIGFFRLIPKKTHYEKHLVGIKTLHGYTGGKQDMLIKRWYYLFDADRLVLDVRGAGSPVYESMLSPTEDYALGVTYKAFSVYDTNMTEQKSQEHINRCQYEDNNETIYGVAANGEFNHKIALNLRRELRRSEDSIKFLCSKQEMRNIIVDTEGSVDELSLVDRLEPFILTDRLITECVMLKKKVTSTGIISLTNDSKDERKDCYSMLAYSAYVMNLFDEDFAIINEGGNFVPLCD